VLNLCRGEGIRVSSLARQLMQRLGLEREIAFQPGTPPPLVGDPSELVRALGWRPSYALADTLDDIVAREPT
jgi:nucleoside-diphosphate-sugar epimerase